LLLERGDEVVVADDLVSGIRDRVPGVPLLQLDLAEAGAAETLASAMVQHDVDSVIHLAARKAVGESVARPVWYYRQNVAGLAAVLQAMESASVSRLVFSSSAAVYGHATGVVTETTPAVPANPYGSTKLVGEWLISDTVRATQLRAISLRYFNVAGAGWPELGDRAVANLVPMVFERIDAGESPLIFGGDFDTTDGTCVRDYVHVLDLAEAHLAALDHIDDLEHAHRVYNVGTGTGTSVHEMVAAILKAAQSDLVPAVVARRAGDPAELVAGVDRIQAELGWSARFGLDGIVRSAWEAHEVHRAEV
jgi:UDP-glucose 4-epimerase